MGKNQGRTMLLIMIHLLRLHMLGSHQYYCRQGHKSQPVQKFHFPLFLLHQNIKKKPNYFISKITIVILLTSFFLKKLFKKISIKIKTDEYRNGGYLFFGAT